jgi:hypothetical protein
MNDEPWTDSEKERIVERFYWDKDTYIGKINYNVLNDLDIYI